MLKINKRKRSWINIFVSLLWIPFNIYAKKIETIEVLGENGAPIPTVMVTQVISPDPYPLGQEDDGYPRPNIKYVVSPEITRFTDSNGRVSFPTREGANYRFRKPGYQSNPIGLPLESQRKTLASKDGISKVILTQELDFQILAEEKPANQWLGAIHFDHPEDKTIFKMQCGFCHQQGSEFTRMDRSIEEWDSIIKRMVKYGSRIPTDMQKYLPTLLNSEYRRLKENPKLLENDLPWDQKLSDYQMVQWPVGDSMSQTHDMLLSKNGLIYVGDNIQDRIYEVNTQTNEITIYKIPHLKDDQPGGLIQSRLSTFPKHDSTSNAHSLAESKKDGHIFITPSAQQRLIEFDPATKKFTIHQMSEGFYPHTIRVDQKDRVWFTLALSNQVAMYDRVENRFTYYDLPARSFKEKIITRNIKWIYQLMNWGVPLSSWLTIDRESTGAPLIYGIDIAPDGKVWAARLHSKEIFCIDPNTQEITAYKTPFYGPRRLRIDETGKIWITSFGDSLLASFDPKAKKFELFDLPVIPKGSETPYSLNIDHQFSKVWVTGNQSNSIFEFSIKSHEWKRFPLPKKVTFTRDVEVDKEGSIYSANSNFPSWHIEDGQPTLIKIEKISR
ncbi:MAG: hypothetical protein QE271_12410 [Bacteriovoracaceae bacterium]|nr:hypothetical protein [Bacteriovoracaceae bacterium]